LKWASSEKAGIFAFAFQSVAVPQTGLSRHWGDDSMSDTIGQYVAGWRIADAVCFGADWNRDRWSIVAIVA
jgi:hypothetical protein